MLAIKRFFAIAAVSLCMSLINMGEAFAFTFTKIADSNAPLFNNFGFFPEINNEGTVVFSVNQNSDGQASSIFIGNGKSTTAIATASDSPFSLFANPPAINNKGTVAFRANLDTIGSGIFTSQEGRIITIAQSSIPRGVFNNPVINNEGTVAYEAIINGGRSIVTNRDGKTTVIADTSSQYSFFDGYSINDANTIAFSARLKTGSGGIFISRDRAITSVADTSKSFSFFFPPTINNVGTVAFKGVLKGLTGEGLYTASHGETTTIVDSSSFFSSFDNPAINDTGKIAFKAFLDNDSFGIFTGADPANNKVISVGDPLFGSTVTNLFFSNKGLNNNNQIAFYATLADGTSGIFRADPQSEPPVSVPESDLAVGLLTVGILGGFLLRWQWLKISK